MNAYELDSYHSLAEYREDLDHVDASWLIPLGVNTATDLAQIRPSERGHRTLMLNFFEHYCLLAQPPDNDLQRWHWIWRGRAFLQLLALRLGLLANADFVRTSVARHAVLRIHSAIGEETCYWAIDKSADSNHIVAPGLSRIPFDAALEYGSIKTFFLTTGRRLLAFELLGADEFLQQCLRLAFPNDGAPALHPLAADRVALTDAIKTVSGEL